MIDPVLALAIAADWFTALILAAFWCARRENTRARVPLGVLTLLHAILVLLCICCDSGAIVGVLRALYYFSPLYLLTFGMIYMAVLSGRTRMPRPLGISCFVFNANLVLQGLLVIVVLIGGYTS